MDKAIDMITRVVIRAVVGVSVIFLLNMYLDTKGIQTHVGMNPVTVAASGILGVPGVALLYGITVYQNFW